MTTETPPDDWILIEAAKLSKYELPMCRAEWLRNQWDFMGGAFRALCDMIAKHEKPPVDRKLLCAQEALTEASTDYVHVVWTDEDIAVRAIELWDEGFGK
jgi:hypothetical protein